MICSVRLLKSAPKYCTPAIHLPLSGDTWLKGLEPLCNGRAVRHTRWLLTQSLFILISVCLCTPFGVSQHSGGEVTWQTLLLMKTQQERKVKDPRQPDGKWLLRSGLSVVFFSPLFSQSVGFGWGDHESRQVLRSRDTLWGIAGDGQCRGDNWRIFDVKVRERERSGAKVWQRGEESVSVHSHLCLEEGSTQSWALWIHLTWRPPISSLALPSCTASVCQWSLDWNATLYFRWTTWRPSVNAQSRNVIQSKAETKSLDCVSLSLLLPFCLQHLPCVHSLLFNCVPIWRLQNAAAAMETAPPVTVNAMTFCLMPDDAAIVSQLYHK